MIILYFTLQLQLPLPGGNLPLSPENKWLYDKWFDQLEPEDGRLSEERVLNFLKKKSGLPDPTLEEIWMLSDQDQDGFLDRSDFTVASHLTRRYDYYGDEIPDQVVTIYISSCSSLNYNTLHYSFPLNCLRRTLKLRRDVTSISVLPVQRRKMSGMPVPRAIKYILLSLEDILEIGVVTFVTTSAVLGER